MWFRSTPSLSKPRYQEGAKIKAAGHETDSAAPSQAGRLSFSLCFMASPKPSATVTTPPPHPFLQSHTLFVGLPNHVLEEHVKGVFEGFNPPPVLTFNRTKKKRNRGALRARIDFLDIQSSTWLFTSLVNWFLTIFEFKRKRRSRYTIYETYPRSSPLFSCRFPPPSVLHS